METWRHLAEAARLTPSPHNVQPWKMRVRGDGSADLLIDPARTLPHGDKTGAFLLSAMAMFAEALRIAAARSGWSLTSEPLQSPDALASVVRNGSDGSSPIPFSRLWLTPAASPLVSPSDSADFALLAKRRTSRLSYLRRTISEEAIQALKRLTSEYGQEFTLISQADDVERVVGQDVNALFHDLNVPDYHNEIARWFRYSAREAAATRDGLSARCMRTNPLLFRLSARFPRLMMVPALRPLIRWIYRRQLGHLPALGILNGPFLDPKDAIAAGPFLLRFWLELARHDLSIHPFGNLVTNDDAARWCRREIGLDCIWLIFKIGYSPEPPAAFRLRSEEIFLP